MQEMPNNDCYARVSSFFFLTRQSQQTNFAFLHAGSYCLHAM